MDKFTEHFKFSKCLGSCDCCNVEYTEMPLDPSDMLNLVSTKNHNYLTLCDKCFSLLGSKINELVEINE